VVFAASDLPLQSADLERDGLVQFPAVMGGALPIVNIVGVKAGDIALDGAVLAQNLPSARSSRGTIRRSSG